MSKPHSHHQELLHALQHRAAEQHVPLRADGDRYIGTTKPLYAFRTAVTRQIAKDWIARHRDLTPSEYARLLDSLARGETANEFGFIGELLQFMPKLRKTLEPQRVTRWVARAEGWAEVDGICYGKFTSDELLANWQAWKRELVALSKSKNVHQRRASLVLLTKPVRNSGDARLANLAFANIARLQREHDILITKAISWLLRDLIKYHRGEVEAYLRDNADTLPKIAMRETQNKLRTGRKSGIGD